VQLGEAEADSKPKTSSLFKSMTLETVTLAAALELLSLPRVVGVHPDDGQEITAQNGRYGPYIKKGSDSRSLDSEEQLLTVELDQAVTIFAQPKLRRGQTAKPPLREMGTDPVSGKPMVVKDGRFGPYVTDGETNASLRKGDTVEELTDERASELLQMRREAGPSTKAKRTTRAKAPATTTKRTVKAKNKKT
jgi:DNA topoisomerase-1